jgi:hypothetical protein
MTHWNPVKPRMFFAIFFFAASVFSGARANLVQNPNFDEGREAVSSRLVQGDTIGAWVVDRASVDIVAKGLTPRHHMLWTGVRGAISIDMGGSLPCPRRDGSIHQDLATVPGQVYQIKFALAGNFYGAPAIKNLIVKWNDSFSKSFSFDTVGRSENDMGWRYCTLKLRASSQNTRLTFDNPVNTSYGPVIDDVSVEPIAGGDHIGEPAIQVVDNNFNVSWMTVENEQYQVQWTRSLANPQWTNLGPPMPDTGSMFFVSEARQDSQRFYRVLILQ